MPTWPNRSVESYLEHLNNGDNRVRRQAAAALGVLGDRSAVVRLMLIIARDESPDVRRVAASALGRLGDTRATESLVGALEDAEPAVRAAAVRALEALADPLTHVALASVVKDPDAIVRYNADRAVGTLRAVQAIAPLLDVLADRPDDNAASVAIARIGRNGAPELIGTLVHRDGRVRALAAKYLGYSNIGGGNPRVVAALTDALHDDDPNVRRNVAASLQAHDVQI